MEAWIALTVFIVVYGAIAADRVDRTVAALLGAATIILFGVLAQEEAFAAVDWNVIFLLAGMMIIAAVLRRTGVFGWLAFRAVRVARGDPLAILLLLSAVTALVSAFLDNVTTVVLILPVTFYVASTLGLSPIPFVLAEVLASNIGGTATLIGDPPNILIGSAAGLTFLDFVLNLTPVVVLVFLAFCGVMAVLYRTRLRVPAEMRSRAMEFDDAALITDHRLLRLGLAVLAIVILAFLVASVIHQEPATIALLGAAALLLLARVEPDEIIREVDWATLLFFIGLFILVEGLVATGVIAVIGDLLADATGGDQAVAVMAMLWVSGIASAIVDNIPYTATMIPVVERLGDAGLAVDPLWWALALGACLGGNATIIGASANVVGANASARAGHAITFASWLRIGGFVALLSLVICSAYLWVRYLL